MNMLLNNNWRDRQQLLGNGFKKPEEFNWATL